MAHCQGCGSYVTKEFCRVFGNNHNEALRCPECIPDNESTFRHLQLGAAGKEDYALPSTPIMF